MSQVAKLFIRGKLINEIAKNLTKEQSDEVEELMFEAWNDDNLSNAKHEFCLALARTIKNEYKNIDIGMNDALINFWRTAVDILYGNHKDEKKWSAELIRNDPIKRKKVFQTWLFNYLKQIIRENKRPSKEYKINKEDVADNIALETIISIIYNNPKYIEFNIDKEDNIYIITIENTQISGKMVKAIQEISEEFNNYNVKIKIKGQTITISRGSNKVIKRRISKRVLIHSGPIHISKEDDDNDIEDYYSSNIHKKESSDITSKDFIDTLRTNLSKTSKEIIDIILNPPTDFLNTYKATHKTNIAKYLGLTKKEMKSSMEEIKEIYTLLDV